MKRRPRYVDAFAELKKRLPPEHAPYAQFPPGFAERWKNALDRVFGCERIPPHADDTSTDETVYATKTKESP